MLELVVYGSIVGYIGYVGYAIVTSCNESQAAAPDLSTNAKNTTGETKKSTPPVAARKPTTKTAKPVARAKNTAGGGKKIPSGNLRNPKTGETTKIGNTYPISKRWIKDALVAEGLLDKVYKVSEIDDAKKIEINLALAKLLKLDKYKVS